MIFNRPNTAFVHDIIAAALAFFLSLLLRLGDDFALYPKAELYLASGIFTRRCRRRFSRVSDVLRGMALCLPE